MPKFLLLSFLAACAFLASVSVMAQTVTDVPLSDADVKIKSAAQDAAQKAVQNASSGAAQKLPTAEEIAAERARLERMRAALAAERAALEKYKADLVQRQQEAAAAAAKAKADAEAKAAAEKAAAEKAVGSAGSIPPPAKDDPIKNMSPEELQRQRQLAIERAKAIEKAVAAQRAADAKKKAAAAASTAQTTTPKDKDVATMKLRRITQNKVKYVHLRDVAVNYGLTFAYTKNKANKVSGAVIYDKTRKAIFSATYRDGTVNGVQVYFLYPMLIKNSEPYISEVDFLTCLDPLLRYKTPVKLGMKTIMIDAGHGGSDPGAINGAHKEKVYTLQIAKRLQTQLEKLGFRVIMTRTGDTYPTLQERAALCKKYKPDLFISIHCNSSTNKTPAGIETYRAVPVGGTETKGSKVKTEKQSANEFDANNSRLAYEIQKGMLAATGGTDRGTRHQAIYVTGNATCPAVLVEVGYLSNDTEVKKIASPDYQNKIVSGILAGLAGYGSFLR
jgi:N-acetylmuramoyl-L-alanine amidase